MLHGTVSGEWGMYLISTTLQFSQMLFTGMSEWPYLWDYLEQTSGKSSSFPNLHEESDDLLPVSVWSILHQS